eukprot:6189212-Pleurochrysis_carterae.AAC.1
MTPAQPPRPAKLVQFLPATHNALSTKESNQVHLMRTRSDRYGQASLLRRSAIMALHSALPRAHVATAPAAGTHQMKQSF